MEPYQELLASVITDVAPLCQKPAKFRVSVERLKSSGDLCLVQFNYFFNSQFSESELTQRLSRQFQIANQIGAWIEINEYLNKGTQLSVELSLRGNVPNSALCNPSWLYGKPTVLFEYQRNSGNTNTTDLLRSTGAVVPKKVWKGESSLDDVMASINSSAGRNLHIIDLDAPDMSFDELVTTLETLTQSGLLAGQNEFLILVHPKFIPLLPLGLTYHMGYKLLHAPLTSHRLINPKSTLMLPYNLGTQNLGEKQLKALKVLLVEDCDLSSKLMRCYLEEKGMEVVHARNGENALEETTHKEFDAILMDLDLPGINGFEASRQIRLKAVHRNTPIIGITASRKLEDFSNCYTFGMNDCISKPLYLNEVVKRIVGWANQNTLASNALSLT